MRKGIFLTCLALLWAGFTYAQFTSVGLIGSATPSGWDADTNMVQNVDSAHLWTLSIALTDGEAKFRADDDWAVNWGNTDFPIGISEQAGPNIPIVAGNYDITFNSNTGWYYFSVASPIGIIGSATPFGWDADVNMFPDTADANSFFVTLDLVVGEAKFRADDDWAVNWGATDFPTGIGTQDGPNIPIARAGNYTITFDTSSGAYSFTQNIDFTTVGIIGDGTPGGWDTATEMTQDANDLDMWTLSMVLPGGGLQFSANDGEAIWGGSDFPTGMAVQDGDTLNVPQGNWQIDFNTATGVYNFTAIEVFSTIGIIGDATPGGWDADTDMERNPADSSEWTLRIELTDGEAKFRADDDWAANWGASDFPEGIGVRDGENIPVTAGEYMITFNSTTGAYLFKELIVFSTVGLIGSATPGGWDADTNMVQNVDSAHLWTLSIELIDGEAKFRADDDWVINWGNTDFPIGIGEQGGPNIPVVAGNYDITFNSNTGWYYFSVASPIGIIGSATPFGWDADVNMFPDTADANSFFVTLDLAVGEAKFRADDDWLVNWGATDFPTGIGTQDGPNIPVDKAGNYTITFDTSSGAYSFTENIDFTTVGIIGDGTPGGWGTATEMTQNANDPDMWTLSLVLPGGDLQFSGNDGEIIWGGSDFPMGVAAQDGDTLNVPQGNWQIDFNTATGAYNFTVIEIFSTMGIIGDATPGGWDADTDMERSPADSSEWTLRVELTDGEAKFRADDDWAANWGAGDFPEGIATRDGANIPITAGEYIITFNSISGAYFFRELIVFDTIGLIGTATPFGDWENDVLMEKDAVNENLWTIDSVALVDGEAKFRVNLEWAINWGAEDWPTGVGTQDGPNILISAGTYGVTLNSATGEYAFGDVITSREDLLSPSSIKVFPNPATEVLNIDMREVPMRGRVNLRVYDLKGQLLVSEQRFAEDFIQMDVSRLSLGHYILHITNDKYLIGKRFIVTY